MPNTQPSTSHHGLSPGDQLMRFVPQALIVCCSTWFGLLVGIAALLAVTSGSDDMVGLGLMLIWAVPFCLCGVAAGLAAGFWAVRGRPRDKLRTWATIATTLAAASVAMILWLYPQLR